MVGVLSHQDDSYFKGVHQRMCCYDCVNFLALSVLSYVAKSHPSSSRDQIKIVFANIIWCTSLNSKYCRCFCFLSSTVFPLPPITSVLPWHNFFLFPSFPLSSLICLSHFCYFSSAIFPVVYPLFPHGTISSLCCSTCFSSSSLRLYHFFSFIFLFPQLCPLLTFPQPLVLPLSSHLSSILPPCCPCTSPAANPFPPDEARYCGCEERCSDSEMCQSAES